MNTEQLKKGNELKSRLENIKRQKEKWEEIQKEKKVYDKITFHGDNGTVESCYIDLDVLCVLTLNTINKSIENLEKEFAEL